MSTSSDSHATDAMAGPHGAGDHGEAHGHDDHGHAGDDGELGVIDVNAWAAGALGIAAGLLVAVLMAVSIGWFG